MLAELASFPLLSSNVVHLGLSRLEIPPQCERVLNKCRCPGPPPQMAEEDPPRKLPYPGAEADLDLCVCACRTARARLEKLEE